MDISSDNIEEIAESIAQAAFEQAPSGLFLISTDSVVLAANRAAIEFLGRRSDPVVGRALWDVLAPTTTPDDLAWLRRAVAHAVGGPTGSCPPEKEIEWRRPERTTGWSVRPVRSSDGRVGSLLVEAHAVTEIRQADREARLVANLALAISEVASLDLALAVALKTVCEAGGWALGEAWMPVVSGGQEVRLGRAAVWTLPEERLQAFAAQGSGFRFASGEGLPGAAWQRREAVWESPLSGIRDFTRAPLAAGAGIRGAIAIPILVRGEPFAVMSCYMTETRAQDERLTRIAVAVASELGPLLRQKSAEESHRNAEAQLTGTIAITTDAIISIDEARRISLFNWGAERIFGYTAEEALGESLDMLLPEHLRLRHAGEIAHFATSAQNARRMGDRSPIVGRRKNGEVFPAEASISRYMAGGRWTFTVILRDITDLRRKEDGLRFLAEVGAVLADLLQDPMALDRAAALAVPTLGDTCVVDLVENDHLVTAAVAARDPVQARLIQESRDRTPLKGDGSTPVAEAMRSRRTILSTTEADAPMLIAEEGDGPSPHDSRAHGSLLVVPLVAHDRLLGSVSFAMTAGGRRHDATYQVLAEEFAVRIASAVDNTALYQRTRQAVAARDETLAVVSHDLRNPLSAIAMCVGALRETPAPSAETTGELLASVQESTALMSRIIQDLLDVASIDAGRLSLERKRESLAPLLERMETMFRAVADECGIALVFEQAGLHALPDLDADAERVVQVLANLLNNALKFTDSGGIVRVSATGGAAGVIVSVSDTGTGIPHDDLPHIFDRFWHGRRRTNIRSTGLGLTISRGIVQAHGGRIWAESTVGCGTTVSFEIPAARTRDS